MASVSLNSSCSRECETLKECNVLRDNSPYSKGYVMIHHNTCSTNFYITEKFPYDVYLKSTIQWTIGVPFLLVNKINGISNPVILGALSVCMSAGEPIFCTHILSHLPAKVSFLEDIMYGLTYVCLLL